MSRCQKCQNVKTLKTELKANREIFSKMDTCAKLRKFCATCAKLFKKSNIFYYPWFLQCMEIIWVNFLQNIDFDVEFNLKNSYNNINNHRKAFLRLNST